MIYLDGIDARRSIDARERFLENLRGNLKGCHVLLHTCDRVELYSDDCMLSPAPSTIARHLFRVASGLESPLLGEAQILHQVRGAYSEACIRKTLSPSIHLLFQAALHTGKKVRSQTAITRGAMSHGQAAVEIIVREKGDLTESVIAVIGVNRLNRNVLRYLARQGARTVFIGNRSLSRAEELAGEFGCEAFPLDCLRDVLTRTDILISATSAPHLVVRTEHYPEGKPMLILDLAVPRDVDEKIGRMDGVTLYNIGDIEKKIDGNRERRQGEIAKAEAIIEEELAKLVLKFEYKRKSLQSA